jgi:hypothetical protein
MASGLAVKQRIFEMGRATYPAFAEQNIGFCAAALLVGRVPALRSLREPA